MSIQLIDLQTVISVYLDQSQAIKRMNHLGYLGQPFLFVIDFDCQKNLVLPTEELGSWPIHFNFNGKGNPDPQACSQPFHFMKYPVSYDTYRKAFDQVKKEIQKGNSYLINLTFETPVKTNFSLSELYAISTARYKLLLDREFTVFSPETFVKIENGVISSYPMKGTIDASLPNAYDSILHDPKEAAEHATIVDLIRNDLSSVSSKVRVEKFRYIEKVRTHEKELLQVSSKISGHLQDDYPTYIGDILYTLLPAGSICGAPKSKTISIIREVESFNRGFYTGICGYFDGINLDSGVMIRFIENQHGSYIFKSGGGITSHSNPEKEYQEYIDKIYVPF